MSTKVRCPKCKGQKQYAGIGGIMKDCELCSKTGFIEKQESKPEAVAPVTPTPEPVAAPVVETVSVEEAFKSMGVPEKVIKQVAEVQTKDLSESSDDFPKPKAPIFLGYDDELMKAVLAEPTMTTEAWKLAYPAVAETSDIRQRHGIRVLYAQSQPKAERKVDISAQQDNVSATDPEYIKHLEDENKKLQSVAIEKTKATKPKKSGIGGM